MTKTSPASLRRVAIYLRISKDDEGKALGVQRQREDCVAYCERSGWAVVEIFEDNDISASTLSKKPRPAYLRMIEGVRAGTYNTIVSYSNSRLTRRPLELEDLIQLYDRTGVHISTVVSGTDDLSTADGRMVARIKASVDAAEAERTSERVKRTLRQREDKGLPHNGYPRFGYAYDEAAEMFVIVEHEADAIRWAYRSMLYGGTFQGVANEWNAQGLATRKGSKWSATTVRQTMELGFVAGLIRGKSRPENTSTKLEDYDVWRVGSHNAIIDMDTWTHFREWRGARRTQPSRLREGRHSLSGLLHCGICGSNMAASYAGGRALYHCAKARDYGDHPYLSVSRARAEAAVLTWLTEVIESQPDVTAEAQRLIAQSKATAAAVAKLDVEIAELEQRRMQAGADFMKRRITAEQAEDIGLEVDSEIEALESAKLGLSKAAPLDPEDRIRAFTTLREEWPRLHPSVQRLALLELVEYIEVRPNPPAWATLHPKERYAA